MTNFVVGILIKVLSNEKVQDFLIRAAKQIVGDAIALKILGALPDMFAALLDQAIKQIPGVENIKDVKQVADSGREVLNKIVPDFDTGIKPLDDILDIWRPKH